MSIKLYKLNISPPARATMMACDVFNVPAEMIDINLLNKEHLTPEFLELNPLHTIPVLKHGDLVLHDSHAILTYLAEQFGKTDALYPKDVKRRALVNQKLFFDTSTIAPRLRGVTFHVILGIVKTISEKQLEDIDECYGFVEGFLTRTKYIAGNEMTIADIISYANLSSLNLIVPMKKGKYPKIQAWMDTMEKQSFCKKYNETGAKELGKFINKLLGK